jgi:hypothetical protein
LIELGLIKALLSAESAKQVTLYASLQTDAELRPHTVPILAGGGLCQTDEKKIDPDESFPGAAASLLPAKDLTVDARIENECGTSGREFFACPKADTSVYSWEIHRQARIPPRAEPVPFGQKKMLSPCIRRRQNFRTSVCQARALTELGRNGGISGGFD